jgi:hypothetical protein
MMKCFIHHITKLEFVPAFKVSIAHSATLIQAQVIELEAANRALSARKQR